ncbi:hypothetical protein [Sphingomonas sp. CFBP 13720]|jgi:hypothetical protein|uniref:hypothetical protein n=1 Tax=Sphingomonas sp. CFBP 13720 TaxID=2775302 RepID=UPI0017830E60|nr:hypothetical protein [Sphingomonas sp. CFBP 13720]MBD8678533.1 hypothetical protein [Sphingomonas sp. CFBP 13720]
MAKQHIVRLLDSKGVAMDDMSGYACHAAACALERVTGLRGLDARRRHAELLRLIGESRRQPAADGTTDAMSQAC